MKETLNIFKKGIAIAVIATFTYACGNRPDPDPPLEDVDTSTSEAITERNPAAANLNEPRPAPIGDTAETANQQQRFGNQPPNVDTAARELIELERERQLRENPNQRPTVTTPPNRRIDGTGNQ